MHQIVVTVTFNKWMMWSVMVVVLSLQCCAEGDYDLQLVPSQLVYLNPPVASWSNSLLG